MTSCCLTGTPVTAKKHSEQQGAIQQGKNASSDKLLEETGLLRCKIKLFRAFLPPFFFLLLIRYDGIRLRVYQGRTYFLRRLPTKYCPNHKALIMTSSDSSE